MDYIEILMFSRGGIGMQIQTNRNQREIKAHGDYTFPVLVSKECITDYEFGTFSWHWHSEIEMTLVEDGEMIYQVNGADFHLKEGDVMFGNANTLHSGHMIEGKDCHYWSITFDPKIVYGFEKSLIQTKYVDLVVNGHEFSALWFDGSEEWHRDIKEKMWRVIELDLERPDFYEMEVQMLLSEIWLVLLRHQGAFHQEMESLNPKELARLKTILGFIHENYDKKITLTDIADSVHICKSECCRFFKKHMNESLFEYLLRYRIEQSILYLQNPEYNITDAAFNCGFADAGYYSRIFRKYTGYCPRDYKVTISI